MLGDGDHGYFHYNMILVDSIIEELLFTLKFAKVICTTIEPLKCIFLFLWQIRNQPVQWQIKTLSDDLSNVNSLMTQQIILKKSDKFHANCVVLNRPIVNSMNSKN